MGWLTSKWFPLPIKGLIFSVNDKNLVFNLSVEVDQCFCSFHDLGVGSIIQSISTIVPNVVQPIHYLPFAPRSRGIIKPFSFNKLSRTSRIHPAWQTRTPEKIQNKITKQSDTAQSQPSSLQLLIDANHPTKMLKREVDKHVFIRECTNEEVRKKVGVKVIKVTGRVQPRKSCYNVSKAQRMVKVM